MSPGATCPAQQHLNPLSALQDPYHLDDYRAYNTFLADINNERTLKRQQYVDNLVSLQRLVLFKFEEDITVVPRDSAWFGFFDGTQLLQMEDTPLYQVQPSLDSLATRLAYLGAGQGWVSTPRGSAWLWLIQQFSAAAV